MTQASAKASIHPWMANLLLAIVSSLLTLGAVEGVVRGLGLFGPQRSAMDQTAQEVADESTDSEDQADASSSRWVIHPYRGLSPRPQKGEAFRATYRNVLGVSSLIEDPRGLPEDDLVIGVFGGSVGSELAQTAGRAVEKAVRERYSTEQNVRVVNFGVSGYKQPQQLTLLMELLLLNVPIDVVVNVDGFNELVLGRTNTEVPFHPIYPDYYFWISGLASTTGSLSPRQIQLQAESLNELERARRIAIEARESWLRGSAVFQAVVGGRILRAQAEAALAEQELRGLPVRKLEQDLWHLEDPCFETSEGCLELVYDNWLRSSILMKRFTESQGIDYFHVLQPNQYLPGSKDRLHPKEKEVAWDPSQPWSRFAIESYQGLRDRSGRLKEQGVDFFDATQIFKSSQDFDYVDICCHLTHGGYRKLGTEIGWWVGGLLSERKSETAVGELHP